MFYTYIATEISNVPQNKMNTWETTHRYYSFIPVLFYHKLTAQSLPLLLIWSDGVKRAVHKPFKYSQICLTSLLERMCYTQCHALAPVNHKMKANLKAANIFIYNYLPSHCDMLFCCLVSSSSAANRAWNHYFHKNRASSKGCLLMQADMSFLATVYCGTQRGTTWTSSKNSSIKRWFMS